jgi:hypothetical protein
MQWVARSDVRIGRIACTWRPGDDAAVLAAMAPVMDAPHAYSQSISTRSSSPTTT